MCIRRKPCLSILHLYLVIRITLCGCLKPACDIRRLPSHVQYHERGSVLKLFCPSGLRPLEVDPSGVIIPSRGRFARYMCIDGQYQRIHLNGTDKNQFLCVEKESNGCPELRTSSKNVSVIIHQAVARVEFTFNQTFVILYCVHGMWHNLHGSGLPNGLLVGTGNHSSRPPTLRNLVESQNCSAFSNYKESTGSTTRSYSTTPINPIKYPQKHSSISQPTLLKVSKEKVPSIKKPTDSMLQNNTGTQRAIQQSSPEYNHSLPHGKMFLIVLLPVLSISSFVAFLLAYRRYASLFRHVRLGVLNDLRENGPRIVA